MNKQLQKQVEKDVDMFNNWRRNVQMLLADSQVGAKELSEKFGWFKGRINNLCIIGGHHKPTVTEMVSMANYFQVSVDNMLHKRGFVSFPQ